ncbi:hypothetical protein TNCV_4406871 [Trichonephila clavipes]|nr:hypothetical protein TNCV_4406871 [Trichonephila clavipes]
MNKNSFEDNEDDLSIQTVPIDGTGSPVMTKSQCGFGARNLTKAKQTCELKKEHFRWEVLEQPPYIPDFAPSVFHLFGRLKKHLGGQNFRTDAKVQQAILTRLHNLETILFSMVWCTDVIKMPR